MAHCSVFEDRSVHRVCFVVPTGRQMRQDAFWNPCFPTCSSGWNRTVFEPQVTGRRLRPLHAWWPRLMSALCTPCDSPHSGLSNWPPKGCVCWDSRNHRLPKSACSVYNPTIGGTPHFLPVFQLSKCSGGHWSPLTPRPRTQRLLFPLTRGWGSTLLRMALRLLWSLTTLPLQGLVCTSSCRCLLYACPMATSCLTSIQLADGSLVQDEGNLVGEKRSYRILNGATLVLGGYVDVPEEPRPGRTRRRIPTAPFWRPCTWQCCSPFQRRPVRLGRGGIGTVVPVRDNSFGVSQPATARPIF